MRNVAALGLVVFLAACGADGEPVTPTMNSHIGVTSDGVYGSTTIGIHDGPISITIGASNGCYRCW
ncbi:hypothetical protein SAMN05444000_10475 [Shimia gijangensis]|uniref:Uncharacterized protein n=1 Tax=Shimia gijangensis TaxID=1470563 RepID=A0A1M6FHJ8_9RHOB|nr:hypothetical protein SAMN05444000_10475 [Shimia gijangensis]